MYRVVTEAGEQLVLRVGAPHANTRSNIDVEVAWLDAINRDTDLDVVRPIRTAGGGFVVDEYDTNLGKERPCVLFTWVPGVPLGEGSGTFGYRLLGQMSALLTAHGKTWEPPERPIRRWDRVFYYDRDFDPVVIEDPLYGHLFDVPRKTLIRKVVDAVQQLRYSGRDVVCSIVGDGPQRDDLARLARQHAAWLRAPGHVPDPQANVFPELDALLLPSEFEGHPRVLLEAMAGGVPCVCSDVGGNAETIRDGQEGFVLHESTAEEIAQRLGQLISTPGLWPQLSASCVRRHAEMFTADRMADNWERLYLEGPASTTCTAAASA